MKKSIRILTIGLAATLTLGMAAGSVAIAETADGDAPQDAAKIYLVPGEYAAVTGATKLTDEQCKEIFTPNAYLCEVAAGEKLPVATTEREGYTFNGWWGIEDATVTYYETVPSANKTTFLYADFRTALSQPRDPIVPDENEKQEYAHYMEVTRAVTGEKERIPLFVSGTDVSDAVQAGYGGPVQFYNEWFMLQPGDEMRIYVSNVYGSEAALAPQMRNTQRKVTLEAGTTNSTGNWLECGTDSDDPQFSGDYALSAHGEPRMNYVGKRATEEHHFRIYIKFYDNGGTMTVYMENQDK